MARIRESSATTCRSRVRSSCCVLLSETQGVKWKRIHAGRHGENAESGLRRSWPMRGQVNAQQREQGKGETSGGLHVTRAPPQVSGAEESRLGEADFAHVTAGR